MATHNQPGDHRVNRANLYRRIGRVCFESGGEPGLPAPAHVYVSPTVELHFDTLGEVAEWVARYDLHPRRWTSDGHLFVTATGLWEGVEIGVHGNQRQFAPADTDPDDLSERHTCGTCGYTSSEPCPWHGAGVVTAGSIEDAPPRGTDAAEEVVPVPADVEGLAHQRGGDWRTEPSGEHPVIKQRGYDPTPTILLGPDQTYEQWYAAYADQLDREHPHWWDDSTSGMAAELAALAEERRHETYCGKELDQDRIPTAEGFERSQGGAS
jgi:hypothetical protein